jgi:hypothetical protein
VINFFFVSLFYIDFQILLHSSLISQSHLLANICSSKYSEEVEMGAEEYSQWAENKEWSLETGGDNRVCNIFLPRVKQKLESSALVTGRN